MASQNDTKMNMQPGSVKKFSEMQLSAISEIENISMGSAATAISTLLNAKVDITTPQVSVVRAKDIRYPNLEPSIQVVIKYIKGVQGSNVMIWKQSDVQLMLNQLMGLPLEVTDDFVFDELNISAICEVMNQMMGASATALSDFFNKPIDISTPIAKVKQSDSVEQEIDPESEVVVVHFDLNIDGVISSEFVSVIETELALELSNTMLQGFDEQTIEANSNNNIAPNEDLPTQPKVVAPPVSENPSYMDNYSEPQISPPPKTAEIPIQQPIYQQPVYQQQPTYQQPVYQQPAYQQPAYQQPIQPVNVQQIQLHQFDSVEALKLTNEQNDNLKLLMSVPLDISVELGKAKRKVKEILEFSQGTIIELDRQAGAPVDVIVNGNLIARGDVVVIDDNFAVRVTEIVKSQFLDILKDKE